MRRTVLFLFALLGALTALVGAILLPVHLRALDPRVLEQISRDGKSLVQVAVETAPRNPAVSKLLVEAAEELGLEGSEGAVEDLRNLASGLPVRRTTLQQMEAAAAGRVQIRETPVFTALRARQNREELLNAIRTSEATRILQTRAFTNFSIFAPVRSAAGLPLDVAVLTTAFLIEQGSFGANVTSESHFKDEVLQAAARGASTNHTAALEDLYLDIFALARRLSSEQLIGLVSNIQNLSAFDAITRFLQENPKQLPIVYSAVVLSRDGKAVAEYLRRFPETAMIDFRFALANGTRALSRTLSAQKPVYRTTVHNEILSYPKLRFVTDPLVHFAVRFPVLAHGTKWLLLFLLGLALAYLILLGRSNPFEEEMDWVPQFGFARRITFAAVFLALTVLLGEPYLAQGEAEEKTPPPRVVFSAIPSPPAASTAEPPRFMINSSTLIAMGVFLVLQGSIYIFCLTKLAEIRRQPLSGPMKLKLLENEENLFDAGLYLGLFGTAASLILLTLGLIKPSLVSAYSSTLFGILFVALLKIFHVRPYKRRLIIESATDEEVA